MKIALRWVAVLPGAISADIAFHYINYFSFIWLSDEILPFKFFVKIAIYGYIVLNYSVIPICFCAVGYAIAPTYKKETGIFLTGIMFMGGLLFAIFFQKDRHFIDYLAYTSFFIGCCFCIKAIIQQDNEDKITFEISSRDTNNLDLF